MSVRLDDTSDELENFMDWRPIDVANFLESASLGDYREAILKHKISGRLLHHLTDQDLKDMGINIVGDRLRLKSLIETTERKQRYNKRTKVWWTGTEELYWNKADQGFLTCCFLCPDDPSTYELSSNRLKIKTVSPWRIGPIKFRCCFEYGINNIDLTQIVDVDIVGEPAPCCYHCCAEGRGHVEVSTRQGEKVNLTVTQPEADKASKMIIQQIEECQRMQRDICTV